MNMLTAPPDLTDAEIDAICAGLRQNAAKVRHLERLGITVRRKPNGRPLVNRRHYDAVCGERGAVGASSGAEPNWGRR